MAYNNALEMYVLNNTGAAAIFAFSHQYTGCMTVSWSSKTPVPPGGLAGPLVVGFFTGLLTPGFDYWYCQAEIPGQGTFATEGTLAAPTKECMCQAADDGMVYYFPFSTGSFVMPLISGPCQTGVS